jgi:hypothetical protein
VTVRIDCRQEKSWLGRIWAAVTAITDCLFSKLSFSKSQGKLPGYCTGAAWKTISVLAVTAAKPPARESLGIHGGMIRPDLPGMETVYEHE